VNKQSLSCTTVARIVHNELNYHLHSHSITYGSGSGQQAVTGLKADNDAGSLWIFKEAEGDKMCLTGDKISCGDKIRLEHMGTKQNLHSHEHTSPVSNRQEVSCFGDGGDGDVADNWVIECKEAIKGDPITGKTLFYLQHDETKKYLHTDRSSMFNQQNCRN
jgi:dolichyl-phosphate-mannose--protein O-mannosyl transferase